MKTMTVRGAKPQLGKLVEKVQPSAPVILIQGDKLAKLERYELLIPSTTTRNSKRAARSSPRATRNLFPQRAQGRPG